MIGTLVDPVAELDPAKHRRSFFFFLAALIGVGAFGTASAAALTSSGQGAELGDCLYTTEGIDVERFKQDATGGYYINFDPTATDTAVESGANIGQQKLDVRVPAGHRTYSTQTFSIISDNCGYDFKVRLEAASADNLFGEPATEGNWDDKGVEVYLSETRSSSANFEDPDDWDQNPIRVNHLGDVVNMRTGESLLEDNSKLDVGFELVGGADARPETGVVRFRISIEAVAK